MRYRPDLDGIRAIAIVAVMAVHTGLRSFSGGWMGVDVFFVLSGFLITTLLVDEHARTGAVSLRRFYARRALRLYPALLVVVAAVGLVFSLGFGFGPSAAMYWSSGLRSVLYVEDFWAGMGNQDPFQHGWSLAVEEQFYLLWAPILVLLLRRRRGPLRWALLGALLSWTLCGYTVSHGRGNLSAALFLPWNRMGPILLGATLALALARGVKAPAFLRSAVGGMVVAGAAVLVLVIGASHHPLHNLVWQSPAIAVATCALIWHLTVNEGSPLRDLLGSAPLRWMGRRSYAMYLIHLPVLYLLETRLPASLGVKCVLMVVITLGLAQASYAFVEMPFLRRKARLQSAALPHEPSRLDPERGGAHSCLRVGIALGNK